MDSRTEAFAACPDTGCDWGSFYLGWKASRESLEAKNAELVALLLEFCERVDRGEVRSLKTYEKFKAVLAKHRGE